MYNIPNKIRDKHMRRKKKVRNKITQMRDCVRVVNCYIQVHPSGNYILMVISPPNYTSLPSMVTTFLTTCCNYLDIPSSMVEILLFDSVFHDGVTPVSVLTLKPPLGVIEAIPLKP